MLVNVQALRAFAAFFVVFVHLRLFAEGLGLGPHAFEFGNAGVDVFFVISGLIMVVTAKRRRPTAQAFLKNRLARIVPFYWLITLVVFAVALFTPALVTGTRADPVDLVKSLCFLPFRRADGMVEPVVFVGWTLNYEMAFYVLFALGLTLRNRVVGFLLTLLVLSAGVALGLWLRPAGVLPAFYSAPIVLEFALGMVIGAAADRLAALKVPTAILLAVGAAMVALMVAAPLLWPKADRLVVFGAPGAVLVLAAVWLEALGWTVKPALLRRLGDASFATYLTHFFVTQAMVKSAELLGVSGRLPIALMTLATFALVALTGLATHRFVERPLNQALRRWLFVQPAPAPVTI